VLLVDLDRTEPATRDFHAGRATEVLPLGAWVRGADSAELKETPATGEASSSTVIVFARTKARDGRCVLSVVFDSAWGAESMCRESNFASIEAAAPSVDPERMGELTPVAPLLLTGAPTEPRLCTVVGCWPGPTIFDAVAPSDDRLSGLAGC
jgi:hypothetical protein